MMKTSKAKTVKKPKKTTKTGAEVTTRKVAAAKSLPGEEEIRKKAMEIYNQRVARGEDGTESDDWHKAEELLRGS